MRRLVTNASNFGTVTECELSGAPAVHADPSMPRLVPADSSAGSIRRMSRTAGLAERRCIGSVSIVPPCGNHPSFRRMGGSSIECWRIGTCDAHGLMPLDLHPSPKYNHLGTPRTGRACHRACAGHIMSALCVEQSISSIRSMRGLGFRDAQQSQRSTASDTRENHESADRPCVRSRRIRMPDCQGTARTRAERVQGTEP